MSVHHTWLAERRVVVLSCGSSQKRHHESSSGSRLQDTQKVSETLERLPEHGSVRTSARDPDLGCVQRKNRGCTQTRKNIDAWNTLRPESRRTLALLERVPIVNGTSSLGAQVVKDLGKKVHMWTWADGRAGIGVSQCRGIRRVRHIQTLRLRILRVLHDRRAILSKISAKRNGQILERTIQERPRSGSTCVRRGLNAP